MIREEDPDVNALREERIFLVVGTTRTKDSPVIEVATCPSVMYLIQILIWTRCYGGHRHMV